MNNEIGNTLGLKEVVWPWDRPVLVPKWCIDGVREDNGYFYPVSADLFGDGLRQTNHSELRCAIGGIERTPLSS